MTQKTIAWDGITTGDAGPYSSADWAELWQYLIGLGGARSNIGPFLGSGTQPNEGLKVRATSPASANIEVLAGSAMVKGRFYLNDATVTLAVGANASGNPRIDTVIVRVDYSLQTGVLAVLQGTPAVSPTPPSLTQSAGVLWEIPLADIAIANGFVSLADSTITPRHEWVNAASGIFLDNVLNNSGGTLTQGAPVIVDTSADRAATTTTSADNKLLMGVWTGRTSNGGYGRVQVRGIGYVYSAAAVTRGQFLITHTVAGQATPLATIQAATGSIIGRALETTSGAGLVLTYINARSTHLVDFVHIQDQKANTTGAASIASGAWRTRELNFEVTDTATIASVTSNQVTIEAGTYVILASLPAVATATQNRARIRNITAGTTIVQGSNNAASSSTMIVVGYVVLTVQTVIELQHWTNSTANGGSSVSTGEVEVYANLFLWRIGEN